MARTSADITIHRIDGTTLPVPITTEARRTWRLGSEDNIRLRWDSNTEYRAKVGDWIDDNVNDGGYGFGKFYVTVEQEPIFDTATGAFRHDIRFDRDYIGWRNVLHMLTYNTGGNTYERKETEWSLTDSLENHLTEIVRGLRVVGYSCANPVVEGTVENPEVAVSMSFSGTSVYDALNALAEAYSCEWWVTYNSSYTTSTIHFGKCESGNAFDITLGDNAEDVTPKENGGVRANRIFAFGSTRNIPETYRKTLTFSVTDTSTRTYDGQTATVFRDSHRVITKDMLKSDEATSKGVNLSLGSFIYGDSTTDPQYRESATAVSAFTLTDAVRYGLDGELSVIAKFTRNDDTEEDGEWSWLLSIDGAEIATGGGDLTGHLVGDTTITVNISEIISDSVYLTAGEHTARLEILTLNSHFYLQYAKATTATATLTPSGFKVNCPLLYNGVTYVVTFNPLSEPYSADTFNWFSFTGSVPSGFSVGKTYTLMLSDNETPGLLPLKIPMSFYSDDVGSITSLRMVGARRLMLPLPSPGYVQTGNPTDRKLVEKVVIFDNIYPKLYLEIYDMTVGTYTDNTEWSDGSRSYGSLPKYTFKVKRIKSDHTLETFNFKRDYLTSDPLQAVFVTYDEAHNNGSTSTSSFLLSGMTFSLNFNEAAQTYTIAYNEDYGAKLPNSILMPKNGDAFILTGWNVNAIQSLGIVDDAEEQLEDAAEAYLEAVSKPTFTWRCRMMSNSMMSSGLLEAGRKVRITRGGLEDTTRVIGFEYKLDIPEDTPEYECGETEAYSRLRELEKALNAKTVNTASASGGSVTSSSSSSSSSDASSLSAVLSWQAGTVDPATFDTFDGSKDKLINIPSEIDHLSNGGLVPRIDEVMETLSDGSKVVRLVDGEGNTVLPSGSMDWFIPETYTENGTTKQRLKLNPKYQGMYAEGWVSAGGIGTDGGGTIVASLPDLTDVNDNLYTGLQTGQALVWDGTKWTGGTVSGNVDPATVRTYGAVKVAAVEGGAATVSTTVYGNRYGVKMDGSGKTYVDINLIATTSYFGGFKLLVAQRSGAAAVSDSMITTGGNASGKYYGVEMNAAGHLYVNVPWTGGGSSGVSSVAGYTGDVTAAQLSSALNLDGYLPLTAGSVKPLTGTLHINVPYVDSTSNALSIKIPYSSSQNTYANYLRFVNSEGTNVASMRISGLGHIGLYSNNSIEFMAGNTRRFSVTTTNLNPGADGTITLSSAGALSALGNGYDIGRPVSGSTAARYIRATYSKVYYLADNVYIYYDTVNGCIRTNAPIVSDSYISAGGVSST